MSVLYSLSSENLTEINMTMATNDVLPISWSVEVGEIWTLDVILLNVLTCILLISACCLFGYAVYNCLHSTNKENKK